ncbi:MAG TPA: tetratricopeptide repeat protein [Bacteroidota bacterium]|nr:tetratricopeptide repeat protein [Bacteroidota bacterium]
MNPHPFKPTCSILAILATIMMLPAPIPAQTGTAGQAASPALTTREWEEDLDSLVAGIPRYHGNAFHAVSKPEFDQAVRSLRSGVGTMNEDQILVGFARLIGMIQDGHNHIDLSRGTDRHEGYPLRVGCYPEGVFVETVAPSAAALAGGKVIAIDGHPIDSVMQLVIPLLPHDPGNLPNGLTRLSQYLLDAHILHGLGVTPTASRARFAVEKGGKTVEVEMHPSVFSRRSFYFPPPPEWVDARPAGEPRPFAWRHPDSTFWLTFLPDQKTVYAQVNGVANGPLETFADFAKRVCRSVRDNQARRVILDLRWNEGGNNYLLKPLIVSLIQMTQIDEREHLFVLTSPTTFSAAQNLVNRLENFTEAIFVGEPTGENVNFYGDTRGFDLPHSRCAVFLANLWWQDKDPRDRRTATFPEIAEEISFSDFMQGRDPAVDYILTHERIPTIESLLTEALAQHGYAGVAGAFHAFRSDPVHRYMDNATLEGRVNNLGYALIARNQLDDAIVILKLNTEEYPASFNTWDSLGEAYANAGRKEDAITAYRKSLELNPTSRTGLDALKKLQP